MDSKTLVILSHPNFEQSHINKKMYVALETLPNVTLHHLESVYPASLDVAFEQQLLRDHDNIVLQFPFYWYSSPPALKNWLDQVFTYNFAYGEKGTALKGKKLLIAITTGGDKNTYRAGGRNNFTISELLRPFQQTANLTQMHYQSPFVVYGVLAYIDAQKGSPQEQRLEKHLKRYKERVQTL